MTKQLYFNYSSTAKIRIKKENCYKNEQFPAVFRIITEKLDFLIPKNAVIFGEKHVFIPNSVYKEKLNDYYLNLKK